MIYCLFQRGQTTCWRAALATILRVGLDDLPEEIDGPSCRERGVSQLFETRRALRPLGYDVVREKPEQTTIRPARGGFDEDRLVVAGVVVSGRGHALVAADVDGVLCAIFDPAQGDPKNKYELYDVTRIVEWPRPSKVAAAEHVGSGT